MKKIKLSLSILLITTFCFSLAAIPSLIVGLWPNTNFLPKNKIDFIESKKNIYDYNNALEEDVKQKSQSDSILIYFINWIATFHKLGAASHLIKILELNPEKEIYFIIRSNVVMDLSAITNNKSKYPNFNFIFINEKFNNSSNIHSLMYFNFFPKEIENIVNSTIDKNKEIDFYCDDVIILNVIDLLINKNRTIYPFPHLIEGTIKNLYKGFNLLKKMKSINMFADGTGSTNFYSSLFYENFLFIGNKIANKKYVSEDFSNEWFDYPKSDNYDLINILMMFMYSFIVTNNKGNDSEKTKYFLPTFQLVNEVNEKTSRILETNENDFFDPYNSLEADLISFCKTFNNDSQKLLISIFSKSIYNPLDYEFMNNNYNYIYSGRLLFEEKILNDEVKKLLYIKQEIIKKGIKNYNVIFKGHPRDSDKDTLQNKLRSKINEFDKSDNGSWLFTIDPKIPYEIYLTNGTFSNNIKKNKEVFLYATFSTINLFLYAEDQGLKMVEKILLSKNEINDIEFMFGEETKIFPKEKWVLNK